MTFLDKLRSILLAEKINGQKIAFGLLKHVADERDLSFNDVLGATGYTPSKRVVEIPTLSVKMQQPFNTCVFASAAVQKERDEGEKLSVRSIVAFGRREGIIKGNGYTSLRAVQDLIRKYGIAEERICPDTRPLWNEYSSAQTLTEDVRLNAQKHKSERYFTVKSKDEIIKAIDTGRIVQVGIPWYTGYQSTGGFKAPWVITPKKGAYISGHAVAIVGFDLDKGIFKFQNSFGQAYGDGGKFYMKIDDFMRLGSIGYVTVDKVATQDILRVYEGKDVKSANDPKIYRIENGKRRWYPNEQIFLSWGGRFGTDKTWQLVAQSILDSFQEGSVMSLKV